MAGRACRPSMWPATAFPTRSSCAAMASGGKLCWRAIGAGYPSSPTAGDGFSLLRAASWLGMPRHRGRPIMLIPYRTLRANAVRIFEAAGSSPEEAEIVADHLVEANLRGHDSHGVGMISIYMKNLAAGSLIPNRRGRLIKEDGAILHYDGERGYGQVTARALTELGIERALRTGLAAVALRNAHHIGRIGSYGEQCAAAGLISLHFVNVIGHEPNVAPHRGADARLGTNPVCIALPAAEEGRPMILDMATSKVAVGKVRVAQNEGRVLAEGLLLDGAGRPTTDPGALFADPGALSYPWAIT